MKGTTIPATSHNLWTGSRAIWLGVIIFGMAGQRVCDLYAYGLVQHIPHKSSTALIYYATTFAGFYFPFADPAQIFRGHMLKPFYINANTRTFRSMLIYVYIFLIKRTNSKMSTNITGTPSFSSPPSVSLFVLLEIWRPRLVIDPHWDLLQALKSQSPRHVKA